MDQEQQDDGLTVEQCQREITDNAEPVPTKRLDDITGLDEEIERCRQTLLQPHIDGHHMLAANTAIIDEHPDRNDTDFADSIAGELCDHGYNFARLNFKAPEMGHRFREAKRVIPYIDAMVEEEPFVVIAEGVDIIESRELAPLQKRLERLSDQDAAVVFIGVYEDDYPHKQEAVPFSNLMDVIISVPEPDTARKREILQETLSSKATDLDISVDLSQLDCESVAEDASALDAYRLQKVVDRAFMIAQTEATTEVSQSHMETAVEQVTEEQSEITADNERHRRQSGSDFETESPDVSFNDVGGLKDVINRIQSVVSIQEEYADIYEQTGFETSHGMLLAGPPGTGKTLLAKAVANELDRTFLSVKGAEMRNPWFGRTEQIIRELFEKADDEAPSVLFFDEFDALAGKRSKSSRSVNQSIVATLLTELDGMESQDDVLVIAATNRKDAIDEALLRPGRLDETITVPVPDEDGQAQIFDIHTDGLPTADDVTGEWFTQQVTDLTGAQIRQVCEETFRKAVQREENPEQLTLNTTDFRSVIESLNHTSSIDMQERPIGYE